MCVCLCRCVIVRAFESGLVVRVDFIRSSGRSVLIEKLYCKYFTFLCERNGASDWVSECEWERVGERRREGRRKKNKTNPTPNRTKSVKNCVIKYIRFFVCFSSFISFFALLVRDDFVFFSFASHRCCFLALLFRLVDDWLETYFPVKRQVNDANAKKWTQPEQRSFKTVRRNNLSIYVFNAFDSLNLLCDRALLSANTHTERDSAERKKGGWNINWPNVQQNEIYRRVSLFIEALFTFI